MKRRTAAIQLKIPDNEAYTALTALRRLGINLGRLERAAIWSFEDEGEEATFVSRVQRNEVLFNPNKHRMIVLDDGTPRAGEMWIASMADETTDDLTRLGRPIAQISAGRRYVGWRLFSSAGPADEPTLRAAAELLLCNPAVERVIFA